MFRSRSVWPRVGSGGATASVEYRRYPEDSGLDYFVHRPSWPESLLLGSQEGHFRLPALRWQEVVPIAEARALFEAGFGNADLRTVAGAGHRLRHDPRAVATLIGWMTRQSP